MLIITERPVVKARPTYTQEQLLAAFKRVENSKNWKNRINRVVTVESDDELDLITSAVIHFTGSVPEFVETEFRWREDGKKRYRVIAAGYYATIGA